MRWDLPKGLYLPVICCGRSTPDAVSKPWSSLCLVSGCCWLIVHWHISRFWRLILQNIRFDHEYGHDDFLALKSHTYWWEMMGNIHIWRMELHELFVDNLTLNRASEVSKETASSSSCLSSCVSTSNSVTEELKLSYAMQPCNRDKSNVSLGIHRRAWLGECTGSGMSKIERNITTWWMFFEIDMFSWFVRLRDIHSLDSEALGPRSGILLLPFLRSFPHSLSAWGVPYYHWNY